MSKILALDIGGKRTGVAETDSLQIIAQGVAMVETHKLEVWLKQRFKDEDYSTIVIGDPLALDGGDSDNSELVRKWKEKLRKIFPLVPIEMQDERFSSKMAMQAMIESGMKKKKRREKGNLDQMSALIILRSYLEAR